MCEFKPHVKNHTPCIVPNACMCLFSQLQLYSCTTPSTRIIFRARSLGLSTKYRLKCFIQSLGQVVICKIHYNIWMFIIPVINFTEVLLRRKWNNFCRIAGWILMWTTQKERPDPKMRMTFFEKLMNFWHNNLDPSAMFPLLHVTLITHYLPMNLHFQFT